MDLPRKTEEQFTGLAPAAYYADQAHGALFKNTFEARAAERRYRNDFFSDNFLIPFYLLKGAKPYSNVVLRNKFGARISVSVFAKLDGFDEEFFLVENLSELEHDSENEPLNSPKHNRIIGRMSTSVMLESRANELPDWCAAKYSYNEGGTKEVSNQIFINIMHGHPDYSAYTEAFLEIIKRRTSELFAVGLEVQSVHIVSSWNSAGILLRQGFKPMDLCGLDTAAQMDKYTLEQIEKFGSKADTRALGSNLMYLPQEKILEMSRKIDSGSEYFNGKGELRKNTLTTKVFDEAKISSKEIEIKLINAANNIQYLQCFDGSKPIAQMVLNRMLLLEQNVSDYVGVYPFEMSLPSNQKFNSPFSVYGVDGKQLDRIFIELDQVFDTAKYPELENQLYMLAFHRALTDKYCSGRLQVEADWGESVRFYKFGFRHQNPSTCSAAPDIEKALIRISNIAAASLSGSINSRLNANYKVLGSIHMGCSIFKTGS